jgi:hypothetical protein
MCSSTIGMAINCQSPRASTLHADSLRPLPNLVHHGNPIARAKEGNRLPLLRTKTKHNKARCLKYSSYFDEVLGICRFKIGDDFPPPSILRQTTRHHPIRGPKSDKRHITFSQYTSLSKFRPDGNLEYAFDARSLVFIKAQNPQWHYSATSTDRAIGRL